MLFLIKTIMLKVVIKATNPNISIFSKSNNIIFTLNYQTTNLMKKHCSHEHGAKIVRFLLPRTHCPPFMNKYLIFLI